MERTVFAVDPGTGKCGLALAHRDHGGRLKLLWHRVVSTEDLRYALHEAFAVQPFQLVIIGGGTHSGPVLHAVREAMPSMGTLVVDEKNTTLQARERYWEHHRRRGWRRLLPATLQVPPEPYDDFVAYILAERVLVGDD